MQPFEPPPLLPLMPWPTTLDAPSRDTSLTSLATICRHALPAPTGTALTQPAPTAPTAPTGTQPLGVVSASRPAWGNVPTGNHPHLGPPGTPLCDAVSAARPAWGSVPKRNERGSCVPENGVPENAENAPESARGSCVPEWAVRLGAVCPRGAVRRGMRKVLTSGRFAKIGTRRRSQNF